MCAKCNIFLSVSGKVSGIQRIKFRFWRLHIYNLRKLSSSCLFVFFLSAKFLGNVHNAPLFSLCVFSRCDCPCCSNHLPLCPSGVCVSVEGLQGVQHTVHQSELAAETHVDAQRRQALQGNKKKKLTVNVSIRCGSLFLSHQIKCSRRCKIAFLSGASAQLINGTKATQVQKIRYKISEMMWKSLKWSVILHMQIRAACCAANEFWQFVTSGSKLSHTLALLVYCGGIFHTFSCMVSSCKCFTAWERVIEAFSIYSAAIVSVRKCVFASSRHVE